MEVLDFYTLFVFFKILKNKKNIKKSEFITMQIYYSFFFIGMRNDMFTGGKETKGEKNQTLLYSKK